MKKRIGISILILLLICIVLVSIFYIEKKQEEQEEQNVGKIDENTTLPAPDRIIYKNQQNQYIIIEADTSEYAKIYSELYNRTTNPIEGKVYSEDEISQMQERGSFIEFDYNTKSKNFVFFFEEPGVGIIKRFTDSGQVIKTSLRDTEQLITTLNKITKNNAIYEKYDYSKDYNYNSENMLTEIPLGLGFSQEKEGVYQKIIQYDNADFQNTLNTLDFETEQEIPSIDFEKQTAVITISQYEIKNIKQNIGNIKYEFGKLLDKYTVNILGGSKIVNTNCIYYNFVDENGNDIGDLNSYVKTATTGIITNISNDQIEIGLNDEITTHIAKLGNDIKITNFETNETISITDLKIGMPIFVKGETTKKEGEFEAIIANEIEICSMQKVKSEVEKKLLNKEQILSTGIEYSNVDGSGNGYIIVSCNYDKFIYPLKLNVNNKTETVLGSKNQYGYKLNEICDITLDTKINNIDNIKGFVKTIIYLGD